MPTYELTFHASMDVQVDAESREQAKAIADTILRSSERLEPVVNNPVPLPPDGDRTGQVVVHARRGESTLSDYGITKLGD